MSESFLLYEELDEEPLTAEELAAIEAELSEDLGDLGEALADLVAPPSDIGARVSARIREQLESREAVFAALDLFGVGLDTVRHLSDPGSTEDG